MKNAKDAHGESGHPPRDFVMEVIETLPEAQCVPHEAHLSLEVRSKRFAWFLDDHHGDGRVSLHVKSTDTRRSQLISTLPDQAFIPSHVGRFGWVGLWLDVDSVDWQAVRCVLVDGYRSVAPKSLLAKLA